MKAIINFFKGILISIWVVLAIFTTVCLLTLNKEQVSEFGDYSLFLVDNTSLEPLYKKYDIVVVHKDGEASYNIGDKTFFYYGNKKNNTYINLGDITDVERNEDVKDNFAFGDTIVSYDDIIGTANGSIVLHKVGFLLDLLESRWGFMFLIILPTIYAVVYEIYAIAVNVKKEAKKEIELEEKKQEKDNDEA